MLVLKRNYNQKLYIGQNKEITITICGLNNYSVSLGIDAPETIPVFRDDVKKTSFIEKKK